MDELNNERHYTSKHHSTFKFDDYNNRPLTELIEALQKIADPKYKIDWYFNMEHSWDNTYVYLSTRIYESLKEQELRIDAEKKVKERNKHRRINKLKAELNMLEEGIIT